MKSIRSRIKQLPKRLALGAAAATLAVGAVTAVMATASPALASGSYNNATIATDGLSHLGQNGGQCKVFANNMVHAASGGSQSPSGYQSGWARLGTQVSSAQAVEGDVIQTTPSGSTDATAEALYNPSNPAKELHTAIIVSNNGNGSFTVVDSNFTKPNTVGEHTFNPYTWAAGSIVDIWRLGTAQAGGGGPAPVAHTQSEASVTLNGVIHLFYYDAGNGDLRHAWADGAGWHFNNLDGDQGSIAGQAGNYAAGVGRSISAVVYDGGIQLFYTAANGALRHAWGDDTNWSFENLDGNASSVAARNNGPDGQSVASMVDASDTLQVFYTAGNGDLAHAFSSHTHGWQFEYLDGDPGSLAGQQGAAGTSAGTSVTALQYGSSIQLFYGIGSTGDLRHAWSDNTGWHFENLDGDPGSIAGGGYLPNVGSSVSAVNDNGTLQLFYTAANGDLRHAYSSSAQGWRFENLDGDRGSIAGQVASYGNPVGASVRAIVFGSTLELFYQNTGNGDLRHAWADGNGWHFENLDGDSGSIAGGGFNSSVGANLTNLVDSSGALQMFYHSASTGDLRHVWANPSGWHFENLDGDSGSIAGRVASYGTNVG